MYQPIPLAENVASDSHRRILPHDSAHLQSITTTVAKSNHKPPHFCGACVNLLLFALKPLDKAQKKLCFYARGSPPSPVLLAHTPLSNKYHKRLTCQGAPDTLALHTEKSQNWDCTPRPLYRTNNYLK